MPSPRAYKRHARAKLKAQGGKEARITLYPPARFALDILKELTNGSEGAIIETLLISEARRMSQVCNQKGIP